MSKNDEATGEVLKFTGSTRIPDTAEFLLEKAKAWGMTRCVIAGWTEEGQFVFGGTHSEVSEALLLYQIASDRLIEHAQEVGNGLVDRQS